MVGRRWWAAQPWKLIQKPLALGLALQILWGSWGDSALALAITTSGKLTETAAPRSFTTLGRVLDQYQPQIKILSPKAGELLTDNSVNLIFEIKDLPIYKDKTLQLGPHLHLVLDDRPTQSIYNPTESVVIKDLEPGTHTLRLFAARPWDESFKNDGAFAQVTFHVFTKTDDNQPQTQKPLLTYNQPQGTYGAEPILLDFYLTNAPLHLIAQENDSDSIQDWKIKATVNGQSFLLDRWQPIYLEGFKPGKNWVQLEFIDQNGNRVENFGNNTARIFNYEPNGQDPLAQLTRGELTIAQAKGIVDPSYIPPAPPKPVEAPMVYDRPEVIAPATPEIPAPRTAEPKVSKPDTKSDAKPSSIAPESITPIIPIVPIPLPQKAPELKAPVTPKPEAKPEKASEAQPKPKKIIQKLLPAFMGPGKKIDVKTPIVAPAPIISIPVAPTQSTKKNQSAKQKPVETKPANKKSVETKPVETKPVEAKPVEKKPESKSGNWLDDLRSVVDQRVRKPADSTATEVRPEAKPEVKPEVKPTKTPEKSKLDSPSPVAIPSDLSSPSKGIRIPAIPAIPLPIQPKAPTPQKLPQIAIPNSEPKITESKPVENNAKRKPSIEARKPFKFNFGKPTAEKSESKPAEIKPIEPKQPNKAAVKQDAPKVPVAIPSQPEIRKPLQLTPGKKVEVKTPVKSEVTLQAKVKPTPEVKKPIEPQVKSEIKAQSKPQAQQIIKPKDTPKAALVKPSPIPTKIPVKVPAKIPAITSTSSIPTPIESIPTITPKSIPENVIKPIIVKPIAKPIVPSIIKPSQPTTKPEEESNLEKQKTDKYEYLKEYLKKPSPEPNRPAS